jgi:hypothetical protein
MKRNKEDAGLKVEAPRPATLLQRMDYFNIEPLKTLSFSPPCIY